MDQLFPHSHAYYFLFLFLFCFFTQWDFFAPIFTWSFSLKSVAVTDLFPLANQCPRQAIRPHTDQSGAECINSSLELFFLALFGSHDSSERTQLATKTYLSRVLYYGHSTWNTFTEEHTATSYTHRRTSLAVSHTSYLQLWHTLSTNSRTNILSCDTKKHLFSLWLVYFC